MRTEDDEKEDKKLEMIWEIFKSQEESTAKLIAIDRGLSLSSIKLARELDEALPNIYFQYERLIEQDWREWCEQYDESADPILDKFHYHRPQL